MEERMSETQRKVCLVSTYLSNAFAIHDTVCGANGGGVTWSEFRLLPQQAQCPACVASPAGLHSPPNRQAEYAASPQQVLSVALFCGALAGALDSTTRALIAAHVTGDGDADALPVLLDRAEDLGLDGPAPQWAEERQTLLEVDQHGSGNNPHVWLPWRTGDEARCWKTLADVGGPSRLRRSVHRCPCGLFEHEQRSFAARRRRVDLPMGLRAEQTWTDEPLDELAAMEEVARDTAR
jgi:hypothetical protein